MTLDIVRQNIIDAPSADAVPKWNCTANFVAEQLDCLRNMTDEERWDFFIKFFSPSADRPTEDYSDLPDIPRAYYEKIVGNMAHEINMLKEQLESAEAVQVVRCKNCRYCTEHYDTDGYPYWMCKEWDGGTDADGYCHCGERKEE